MARRKSPTGAIPFTTSYRTSRRVTRRGRESTASAHSGGSSLHREGPSTSRSGIVRDALGIALASGAYALSFGAISTTAGLSLLQTMTLSLVMFTGASQFAMVGVIGTGGTVWAGAATAVLLGTRNALYGV